jgi:hypothetical protein
MRLQYAPDPPFKTADTEASIPGPRLHAGGFPDVVVNEVRLAPVIVREEDAPLSFSGALLARGLSFGFGPVKISGVRVEAAINAEIALRPLALEIRDALL